MRQHDTGHDFEQGAGQMISGAYAGRTHVDGARIGTRVADKLTNRPDRHRKICLDDKRLAMDACDRRNLALEIEPEI